MDTRIHYMDNLRALAMLAGIFFHAAIAYHPMMHCIWLTASDDHSVALEAGAWFTHLFRMPLFFMISGFFAHLLIDRRGIHDFLIHRFKRIFMPFMIFLPLVLISTMAIVGWAISSFEELPPMMMLIKEMQGQPEAAKPPFSTMHLWFLFNLMLFCLVAAAMAKLNVYSGRWFTWLSRPAVLLLVVPLCLIPALVSVPMPHPAPERIYPELWSFGFNGVFFLMGIAMYTHRHLIERIQRYTWMLILASIAGYALFYLALPKALSVDSLPMEVPLNIERVMLAAIEAYVSVWMSLTCLALGHKWLNICHGYMRYIADASYWVYILHLPVLFLVQFHLLKVQWGAWIEFALSSVLTLGICFLTYALFVRSTPIGYLLNGRRYPLRFWQKSPVQPHVEAGGSTTACH